MLAVNKESGGGWSSVLRRINPHTSAPRGKSWRFQRGQSWFRVRSPCCGRWREGKEEAASREEALGEVSLRVVCVFAQSS